MVIFLAIMFKGKRLSVFFVGSVFFFKGKRLFDVVWNGFCWIGFWMVVYRWF